MPAQPPPDPDTVVDALYTRPLDDFVAVRDAAVRQAADAGDRLGAERLKRLRKPSVAAWVINQVVRDRPEEVAALAGLGDELRAATSDRDRGRLKALDHLRRERTEALVRSVREAGDVGGRPVSQAVLDRLAETLTAAVMDPDAAASVRAGRLSRALQHVGFGIVDEQGEEADLVELRPAGDAAAADDETTGGRRRAADEPARERADAGRAETGRAETGRAAAERAVEESAAEVDRLEERRDDLRERLRAAAADAERGQAEVERLDQELDRLTAERDAARRAVDAARTAEDEARAELTALDDELDAAEERAAAARRRRREARGR